VRRACVEQQPNTETAAADELAERRLIQRQTIDVTVSDVDVEIRGVVTEWHG